MLTSSYKAHPLAHGASNLWDLSSFKKTQHFSEFPLHPKELLYSCEEKNYFAGQLQSVYGNVLLHSLNRASGIAQKSPFDDQK